jgi:hypothetical protein
MTRRLGAAWAEAEEEEFRVWDIRLIKCYLFFQKLEDIPNHQMQDYHLVRLN